MHVFSDRHQSCFETAPLKFNKFVMLTLGVVFPYSCGGFSCSRLSTNVFFAAKKSGSDKIIVSYTAVIGDIYSTRHGTNPSEEYCYSFTQIA